MSKSIKIRFLEHYSKLGIKFFFAKKKWFWVSSYKIFNDVITNKEIVDFTITNDFFLAVDIESEEVAKKILKKLVFNSKVTSAQILRSKNDEIEFKDKIKNNYNNSFNENIKDENVKEISMTAEQFIKIYDTKPKIDEFYTYESKKEKPVVVNETSLNSFENHDNENQNIEKIFTSTIESNVLSENSNEDNKTKIENNKENNEVKENEDFNVNENISETIETELNQTFLELTKEISILEEEKRKLEAKQELKTLSKTEMNNSDLDTSPDIDNDNFDENRTMKFLEKIKSANSFKNKNKANTQATIETFLNHHSNTKKLEKNKLFPIEIEDLVWDYFANDKTEINDPFGRTITRKTAIFTHIFPKEEGGATLKQNCIPLHSQTVSEMHNNFLGTINNIKYRISLNEDLIGFKHYKIGKIDLFDSNNNIIKTISWK